MKRCTVFLFALFYLFKILSPHSEVISRPFSSYRLGYCAVGIEEHSLPISTAGIDMTQADSNTIRGLYHFDSSESNSFLDKSNSIIPNTKDASEIDIGSDMVSDDKVNIHLTGMQIISNLAVSCNLIIETGADITLNGDISMGYNSTIIVNRGARLHINGAIIGPFEGVSSWSGFRVVGNSSRPQPLENTELHPDDAGILIINNDAQINHARKAVSMKNHQIVWDKSTHYNGGLVIAENAIFNFNHRSFEFMEYAREEKSRIIDCTFNFNSKNAITIWRNNGLLIEGNHFNNFQKTAIYFLDAPHHVVHDNIFDGINNIAADHYGIRIHNTNLSSAHIPQIERNVYNANGSGIFLTGLASAAEDLKVN